jgi:hypothetical protein
LKNKKSLQSDHDMQSATAALVRASQRARILAAQTGTEFVVIRDGQLVREIPQLERPEKVVPSGQNKVS